MRFSKAFIKTYKEVPKESETISHQLMLRSSMIKQLARGVYSYLPLGYKVIRKIENIVREEMNKSGANEINMPIMQPATLWEQSGRWFEYGPELMRFNDRNKRDFVLGPTHEEVSIDIFKDMVSSYKDLPLNIYQIQTKFRDEMRPRFGLMRGREFIMKDAYSFHSSEESLNEEYQKMKKTYENIFKRCGLNFRAVEADTGSIGGSESHEFMVLAESGEDDILYSNKSDYAANVEKAKSILEFEEVSGVKKEKKLTNTPNCEKIEDISKFLNVEEKQVLKTILLKEVLEDETKYYMAIIRGDLEINDIKVKNILQAKMPLEMMDDDDIKELGLAKGYVGAIKDLPLILENKIKVVMDESVKHMENFVVGSNKDSYHIENANLEDIHFDLVGDIRTARVGEKSPVDEGTLEIARGIEVGHIFKLGTKYTDTMNVKILDENGKQKTVIMGCYGIGVSRIAAATIEQNFDENGIIWPISLAPYIVDVIIVNTKDEEQNIVANRIYDELQKENIDTILDDRNERPGFKFKDADLIGFPLKIIVGKTIQEGKVEVKNRKTGESKEIEIENILEFVKEFINTGV